MIYKVDSTVTTTASRLYFESEGEEIAMTYEGNAIYKSTNLLDSRDAVIDVKAAVKGINGTAWTTEIEVSVPEDPDYKKLFKRTRKIHKNGTDAFFATIKLAN